MAIGRPVSLTSNVASKTISVTATASQTLFTVTGGYRINQLAVFRNGVRLVDGTDYTARDGASVTLLSAATAGDTLEFQIFDDFRVADAIVSAESDQTIYGNLTVTGTLTGASIGIQSAGTSVGSATTLNFIGVGNTFAVNGNTIDISIAGGGGGAGSTYPIGTTPGSGGGPGGPYAGGGAGGAGNNGGDGGVNTGGGGGGQEREPGPATQAGRGGSGIVLIAYPS